MARHQPASYLSPSIYSRLPTSNWSPATFHTLIPPLPSKMKPCFLIFSPVPFAMQCSPGTSCSADSHSTMKWSPASSYPAIFTPSFLPQEVYTVQYSSFLSAIFTSPFYDETQPCYISFIPSIFSHPPPPRNATLLPLIPAIYTLFPPPPLRNATLLPFIPSIFPYPSPTTKCNPDTSHSTNF